MSARIVILLVLAGCNEILGLKTAAPIDAAKYDAPVDAPFECPAIGSAPAFSTQLHQYLFESVKNYAQTRVGRAYGLCVDSGGLTQVVCEGPLEGPFATAVGVPPVADTAGSYLRPWQSPDGERMILTFYDYILIGQSIQYWARNNDGSWTRRPDPPFANNLTASSLAVGPTGYITLVYYGDRTMHEWVDEAGTWRELRVHPALAGVSLAKAMTMTGDGLRALVSDDAAIMYTDRPSVAATFRAPGPVDGVPPVGDEAALSDDCARVYMSGLGFVFYAQQK